MAFLIQKINRMLFYLNNSLIVGKKSPKYHDVCRAIFNIAHSALSSYHLLLGDLDVIEFFREQFKGDPIIGPLFNELYQHYSTNTIPHCLTHYLEIVLDNPHSRKEGMVEIHQKSYSDFLFPGMSSETSFVCEDFNDSELFAHILKQFMKEQAINASFAFHSLNGGGANTHRVVEKELNDQHFTICIVDKDIRFPGNQPDNNSTCKKCEGIGQSNINYKLIVLDVHEIENIIPLNYIDLFDIWKSGHPQDAVNKRAFDYLKSDSENILPFFDYKKGIRKNELFRTNHDYQNFAQKCYELNEDKMSLESNFSIFVGSINDDDVIYEALLSGSGIITRTIQLIKLKDVSLIPDLTDYQKVEWEKIGVAMLNWCIARNSESIH